MASKYCKIRSNTPILSDSFFLITLYANIPLCAEEKEPLSEGESGASSEEHQERQHHHYSSHPSLRGESSVCISTCVSNIIIVSSITFLSLLSISRYMSL